NGTPNWQFETDDNGDDDDSDDNGSGRDNDGEAPKLPILKDVLIQNVSLTYRDGVTGESHAFDLAKLALQGDGPDAPMKLDLAATFDEIPITASGQLGAANALTRNESFPITLALDALGFAVRLDGAVDKPAQGDGIDLHLTVNADDLSGLAVLAGDGLPAAGPLELSANLRGGPASITLEDIALLFGATDLSGAIKATTQGARPRITGTLSAQQIDLNELIPPAGKADSAAAPAATESTATASDEPKRVFPNDPLPLDGLKAVDVDVAIRIAHLITPSIAVDNIAVDIALDNGNLAVKPFAATLAGTALTGDLGLTGGQAVPGLTLNLKGPELDIGQIVTEARGIDMLRGSGALDVELIGQGQSVAAIMASLDGHARLVMEEGQVKTESFDLFISGLSGVVGSFFGGKDEWTVLECLAANFRFEDGVGTTAMLMDTEFVSIIGEGGLNLGDETLDMKITPQSKSATLSLAFPIKIGGTFAAPSFKPDELAAARKIGGLLGATLFPPAALLALGDLGAGENSCVETATAAPPEGSEQPAATAVPAEVPKVTEDVKEAIESLGEGLSKGLKGLLGK
ncbi:MAG: AsmA family protein, partial [Alphaproteobacteria bacterium]